MGEAKRRGSFEQRVEQARSRPAPQITFTPDPRPDAPPRAVRLIRLSPLTVAVRAAIRGKFE